MSSANSQIVDKVLSGARWATVLRLTGQAVSWLSTIIVVRYISPDDYGLNAMLEAPTGAAGTLMYVRSGPCSGAIKTYRGARTAQCLWLAAAY